MASGKRFGAVDDRERTFGPAPSNEVTWCVTRVPDGLRVFVKAQTAFGACKAAGWSLAESKTEIVENK